jgi:hypothetical protein
VQWLSRLGLTYQVQVSEDLLQWTDSGSRRDGTGASLTYEQAAGAGAKALFFRVVAALLQR